MGKQLSSLSQLLGPGQMQVIKDTQSFLKAYKAQGQAAFGFQQQPPQGTPQQPSVNPNQLMLQWLLGLFAMLSGNNSQGLSPGRERIVLNLTDSQMSDGSVANTQTSAKRRRMLLNLMG